VNRERKSGKPGKPYITKKVSHENNSNWKKRGERKDKYIGGEGPKEGRVIGISKD